MKSKVGCVRDVALINNSPEHTKFSKCDMSHIKDSFGLILSDIACQTKADFAS